MINQIRVLIRKIYINKLIKLGMSIGENFQMEKGCYLDTPFAWLISIGNNVTLASRVYIIAHDASTKCKVNYTKVGKVKIGNNVFVGAHSIILPNVSIGDNVIIGAGSVVTRDVDDNSVVVGNPIKKIASYDEYINRNLEMMKVRPVYDESYTLRGNVNKSRKEQMKRELDKCIGYID